jgi:hypothetical protein
VKHGLVVAQPAGNGIETMDLSLSSKSRSVLDVTVDAGMMFEANSSNVQSMVATNTTDVTLNPGDSGVTLTVDVSCTNMNLEAPAQGDTFYVQGSHSSDLRHLVNLADFQQASPRVQQFAVWTITDNPTRDGFVELCSTDCSGPTDDEMNQIRQLLVEAGMDASKYAAFQ